MELVSRGIRGVWRYCYDFTENVQPRSGHKVVATKNYFYIIGGFKDTGGAQILKEVFQYNKYTNVSVPIDVPNLPEELLSFSAVHFPFFEEISESVVFLGGSSFPFGQTTTFFLHWMYFRNGRWNCVKIEEQDSCRVPEGRYGATVVFDETKQCIYAIGGTDGHSYFSDVYIGTFNYVPDGDNDLKFTVTWRQLCLRNPYAPLGSYKHETLLFKNKLYTFGGGNGTMTYDLHHIFVFDLATNEYSVMEATNVLDKSTMPLPRKCFAISHIQDRCYVFAGQVSIPDGEAPKSSDINDIWELNLNTMYWTLLRGCLMHPVFFLAAGTDAEGSVILFGGNNSRGSRNNNLYRVDMHPLTLKSLIAEKLLKVKGSDEADEYKFVESDVCHTILMQKVI
uniref:Kelch domain-containing protein 10 n=1 Tax=Rhabditophanes sp. KR3021 TaxID=114890 RepID=A0AC35UC51_9BILA